MRLAPQRAFKIVDHGGDQTDQRVGVVCRHPVSLVSCAGGFYIQCLASPYDSIEDSAGRLGPAEAFGSVHVVGLNESADLFSQFGGAGEDAAPLGAPLQLAEPGLDRIEPGRSWYITKSQVWRLLGLSMLTPGVLVVFGALVGGVLGGLVG